MSGRTTIQRFALIIGAMKCGTTSLFHFLGQHPQIAKCSVKEPNFFASDRNWERGLEWYESLWDWKPAVHRFALEGSTHYTKQPHFPNAAVRISSVGRDFRLIYIMREPVERLESHLTHGVHAGWFERRRFIAHHQRAIDIGRYAMQLDAYRDFFDTGQLLLLDFEELSSNPRQTVRRVFDFLGLSESVEIDVDQRMNVTSDKIDEHPLWRWLKRSRWLEDSVRRHVPNRLRAHLRARFGRSVEAQKLSSLEKQYVTRHLTEDIERLSDVYEFDTSHWQFSP